MDRCHSATGATGIGLTLVFYLLMPASVLAQPVSHPHPVAEPRYSSEELNASTDQEASSQEDAPSSEETSSSNSADASDEDVDTRDKSDESDESTSRESARTQDVAGKDDQEYDGCNKFIAAYMESASRKLFRALQGHDYRLRPIELQEWLDIEVGQGDSTREVSFEVLREKEGLVVSLVDSERNYRTTFVAALTTDGPVIASFEWPSSAAVEGGEACRPTRSKIERPSAPLSKIVDIEPFKFWGLRVVWRLPSEFKGSDSDVAPESHDGRGDLYAVLVDVVGSK